MVLALLLPAVTYGFMQGDVMSWGMVGSWTYSTPVANIDFANLGDYDDVRVLLRGTTLSGSGIRMLLVGNNNGPPFLTSLANYVHIGSDGYELTDFAAVKFSENPTSIACDGDIEINMFSLVGPPKIVQRMSHTTMRTTIIPVSDRLRAIRINSSPSYNYTGGSIYIYAR